jgi:hypothetical protein
MAGIIFGPKSNEPRYQGKPLSHWLKELDAVGLGVVRINGPAEVVKARYDRNRQGTEALQAIGTNALPPLLAMLHEKDSYLSTKAKPHWQNHPWLFRVAPPAFLRQRHALHGLYALGPLAAPALPDLIAAATEPNLRDPAVRTLGVLGPPGFQVLTNLLTDRNFLGRAMAIRALADMGPAAKPAVPALLACLNANHGGGFPTAAAEALLKIGEDPALVIDGLIYDLHFKQSPRIQEAAAAVLGRLGPKARSAVPSLLRVIAEKSPASRAAAEALKLVDPEAADQAGLK